MGNDAFEWHRHTYGRWMKLNEMYLCEEPPLIVVIVVYARYDGKFRIDFRVRVETAVKYGLN